MQRHVSRFNRLLQLSAAILPLVGLAVPARADIFQWEYINPADPSQGKRQSTILAPDGAGVDAVAGADFYARDLSMAYLIGADLTSAHGYITNLANADLSQADLTNAFFRAATLTDVDLTGAKVRGASFENTTIRGFTAAQLYSTASYQAHDLTGISLGDNDLSGWSFAGQNLANARFYPATLTNADFTGAEVRGATFYDFYGLGLTLAQLYSTASYQAHDLTGIVLNSIDLRGGNFVGQNLTNAVLGSLLTGADFTGAEVRGATFDSITPAQLYSTASYQAHDLTRIQMGGDLTGWNFAGQNLTKANFSFATLTDADFTDAEVRGANFHAFIGTGITLAQLYSTASYQAGDLSGINFFLNDLTGGNFAGQNLTSASLERATLTDADFTDADVRGANFQRDFDNGTGITLAQLYSTASYRVNDLSGIGLAANDLAGGNFAGQNLTNVVFSQVSCGDLVCSGIRATLTDADLTAADARGTDLFTVLPGRGGRLVGEGAIATNLIRRDGHITGLDLDASGLLVVRDYDGNPSSFPPNVPIPVTVDQHLTMGPGGTLRMVFEADAWDSTISFAPGIPVTLGGTLELTFANDVNLASQIGRTFDLFDWTGIAPTGAFAVSSPYQWNLTNLYTTGEVTLAAVPEPASIVPLMAATLLVLNSRRALFAFAVVVLIASAPPAFADMPMTGAYVPELQAVDALLQSFMAGKPIPGGTLAITHDDKVIYERGIGYSNEARTIPMQETALMRLASVSKPITASAIQQLAKDGQLSLDDNVFNIDGNGGILNITPYNGTLGDSRLRDITLQHLLEHKGGWNRDIAGDLAFEDVSIATTMGVPSPPGIANSARYILSRPLQFTPGSAESYSNIGYMFLGMVVEATSGQAYESYVDNHVLAPAGIPTWEVDAGRTFAVNQNPREPVYSSPDIAQNVYNPGGPLVSGPYGGWDHEKFLAFGGLIASSKAITILAQSRIASGPEIGKLRSEYTTNPEYTLGHIGALPGTLTLMVQESSSSKDWTYSILFDWLPANWYSDSFSLFDSMQQILEGFTTWPEALVYAGDFTSDQWLTLDDITLFKQALALGGETAFTLAYPTARYGAGDFDGNGQVNGFDAVGLIGALQRAGVPAEYVAQVFESPGDFDLDGDVDGGDFLTWQRHPNIGNLADWQAHYGTALTEAMNFAVPEPATIFLAPFALAAIAATRGSRRLRTRGASQVAIGIFSIVVLAAGARADIFQWEYVNPADPSQGKRQSTTLAPDGAGVDAVPSADVSSRNLTMAYLIGADLTNAYAYLGNLTNADLSQANLTNASLSYAKLTDANLREANLTNAGFDQTTLTDADFTGAEVRGANFGKYFDPGTGITLSQLYSTASYQAHDLTGIVLAGNDLSGANFAGQNLTNANFRAATLSDADFNGAEVRGARLLATTFRGFTAAQLYSTASYQAHDLTGISLGDNIGISLGDNSDLSGWNFVGQNLTDADFSGATLTDADFNNAEVQGARFGIVLRSPPGCPGGCFPIFHGTGITTTQLYSTASYQAHDLSGIDLSFNNLAGANFAGQNLTNATFFAATLTDADFTGAEVRGAVLRHNITLAQLYSTASYQSHDLTGVDLSYLSFNVLSFANFAEQNLTNAVFYDANLRGANFRQANLTNANFREADVAGADFSGADARQAYLVFIPADAIVSNLIRPDGHISGLGLDADRLLVVRDNDGRLEYGPSDPPIPITIDQHLAMGPGGTLRMVFEADAWDSTISFAPGIPVTLGGTLELTFAADVNLATQLGRTFDLFDWTGVAPTGAFEFASPYWWDVSRLDAAGEVTLLPDADFNGDGHVDGGDRAVWTTFTGLPGGATNAQGDADYDHDVDGADFLAWQSMLGATQFRLSPDPAVPEPASVTLAMALAAILVRRPRSLASGTPHQRRK